MEISFENMIHEKSFFYEDESMSLSVWGNFFREPKLPFGAKQMADRKYSFLNFDGGYVAFFCNKRKNSQVIFCSHKRSFDTYYIVQGNKIVFSDSFYYLVSKLKTATWNLDSLSDYFEGSWNHICKYDRTPFKEIGKLDTWHYIEIKKDTKVLKQRLWKKLNSKIIYKENNLDDFKKAFFEVLDSYLADIHGKNNNVCISLSGGTDTNTIAAEWSKLYPNDKTTFFTSKFDDVTDESKIASHMQSVISSKIHYVPIKIDETDIVKELYDHMQSFVPPRFLNLLSEKYYYTQLVKSGITWPYISGMGADGMTGFFGEEYRWLMKEMLKKGQREKALRVYEAIQVSFTPKNTGKSSLQIKEDFDRIAKEFYRERSIFPKILPFVKKCVKFIIRYKSKSASCVVDKLLSVPLPIPVSTKIKSYNDAIAFASYDGGLVDESLINYRIGLRIFYPFEGYKFVELAAHCDPYIFSKGVNKFCLRYAVAELLPKEILENKMKSGQPGVTAKKVFDANKIKIEEYVRSHNSSIVNVDELKMHVQNNIFDHKEFLCLSLIVFEDILKTKYGLSPCVNV